MFSVAEKIQIIFTNCVVINFKKPLAESDWTIMFVEGETRNIEGTTEFHSNHWRPRCDHARGEYRLVVKWLIKYVHGIQNYWNRINLWLHFSHMLKRTMVCMVKKNLACINQDFLKYHLSNKSEKLKFDVAINQNFAKIPEVSKSIPSSVNQEQNFARSSLNSFTFKTKNLFMLLRKMICTNFPWLKKLWPLEGNIKD